MTNPETDSIFKNPSDIRHLFFNKRKSIIVSPIMERENIENSIMNSVMSNITSNLSSPVVKSIHKVIQDTRIQINQQMKSEMYEEIENQKKKSRFSKMLLPNFKRKQTVSISPDSIRNNKQKED